MNRSHYFTASGFHRVGDEGQLGPVTVSEGQEEGTDREDRQGEEKKKKRKILQR